MFRSILSLLLPVAAIAAPAPRVLVDLPVECNTPDGCTLDARGGIILSVPNFNNERLVEAGVLEKPAPARMMRISREEKLETWYRFKPAELHPETGVVGPMDCAFGPDGHLYLADNQGPGYRSRLLRIRVEDGKAVSCAPVVEGFGVANAVAWKGDTVYVSDTVLIPADEEAGTKLVSGVYAIPMKELEKGAVKLAQPTPTTHDPRLIARYETSGRIGFGADGLTFDGEGNLYCSIFEDGLIYRTRFGDDGEAGRPELFAKAAVMKSADGIEWRAADNRIYVADMLANAVQVVSMDGSVETLHRNGDTDGVGGLLDQPCEVLVDGDRLVVVNMDWWWDCEWLTNSKTDVPFNVSVIGLE
ncbi:hypothetical protein [Haloferula sp. A504]|uniref:hypothetical protein n=1 Tax=Haloferula sp. A504 TaxID=3373601 RepID=UPI0031BCE4BE|nr:hypothetical protein [Verrucomicrobiaceae bacterium E54]